MLCNLKIKNVRSKKIIVIDNGKVIIGNGLNGLNVNIINNNDNLKIYLVLKVINKLELYFFAFVYYVLFLFLFLLVSFINCSKIKKNAINYFWFK